MFPIPVSSPQKNASGIGVASFNESGTGLGGEIKIGRTKIYLLNLKFSYNFGFEIYIANIV